MKKLLITSIAIVTVAAISGLLINQQSIGAEEKPPIIIKVEEHEERISTLEDDVDAVETKVEETGAKVKQTETKVKEFETKVERVEVIQKEYVATPSQPAPVEPEPVVINPLTVVDVNYRWFVTDKGYGGHLCTFTLHNGEVWWTRSVSPAFTEPKNTCQYEEQPVLTDVMKRNLTNRPYDNTY